MVFEEPLIKSTRGGGRAHPRAHEAEGSPGARGDIPVLFLDEGMVVVDKPAGVAVHRGWARERDVLTERLRTQLGRAVFPVHRLDRGTSGVLVLALDAATARALGDAFAAGAVEKRYLALVRGIPAPRTQWIDHPIPRDEGPGATRVRARTHVQTLGTYGRYALVEARPETGRLHQIRRHLKHISCPVIGDVNYGKGLHNRWFRERHGLRRMFLHAAGLRLQHPRDPAARGPGDPSDQRMTFEAPLPPALAEILLRLAADPSGPDADGRPPTIPCA
jgi:tRNA pseudouridine65 synthase